VAKSKPTFEVVDRDSSTAPQGRRPVQRRVRVAIRRVNPWSVLKVSLVFYLCLMLVILVGFGILYAVLSAAGILDSFAELLEGVGFGDAQSGFQFNTGYIFRTLLLIGVVSTGLWAVFTVFLAFLYNLIADLMGGIEVTLIEKP
jgi:ABC-type amino acid transport system permease subunit